NNGDASLGANQPFETESFTFRGATGDENCWIVWSISPVGELESTKFVAFQHPKGGLTGQSLVNLRKFLSEQKTETGTKTFRYKASQTAIVRGKGDLLVTLAQFRHR